MMSPMTLFGKGGVVQLYVLFMLAQSVLCRDPDTGRDMFEIVASKGYPIEKHTVKTEDGYLLGLFRIPHGKPIEISSAAFSPSSLGLDALTSPRVIGRVNGLGSASSRVAFERQRYLNADSRSDDEEERIPSSLKNRRPAVLLQHGLLDSSYTFVNNFPHQSLAYILADAGFDVWLGNNRGTFWSSRHEFLRNDTEAFWDFTWDEMAMYDLPAEVNYIINATGHSSIGLVGHSQGTTQAFAALAGSRRREMAGHINIFVALAPVAFVGNQHSLALKLASRLYVDKAMNLFGWREFLPSSTFLQKIAPQLCSEVPAGCDDVLFLICGPSRHVNATRIQVYVSETPSGTSVKNVVHWGQAARDGHFRKYDYGTARNIIEYGRIDPPEYDLGKVDVPVALFYGTEDDLTDPTDIESLEEKLPSDRIVKKAMIYDYNHLDFVWAIDAHQIIYQDVVKLLRDAVQQ